MPREEKKPSKKARKDTPRGIGRGTQRKAEEECCCFCLVTITSDREWLVKLCGDAPKKLKLSAEPFPRGGTYKWSVIKGADKVDILGTGTSKTIKLKAKKKSAAKLDTEIKVVYTVNCQQCEATIKLTVRKPTTMRDVQVHQPLINGYVRRVCYTVQDQFGEDLKEAGMKPREAMKETTRRNHDIGVFRTGNFKKTDASGSFYDYLSIRRRERQPVWADFLMVIDQKLSIGRCRVRHNILTYRSRDVTVARQ